MAMDLALGNVPVPRVSIVGREALLTEIGDCVLADRLITLIGVGGVGKTRLALEAATRLAHRFTDGVWLVELASVGESSSVPDTIASALGVTPQGDTTALDAVAEAVAGRRLLLVLDNCEHLGPAVAAAVEYLLRRAATLTVLATSRECLWVAGEQRLSVAPLGLEGGVESDAVRLFVERARAVRPDFELGVAHVAAAVVEICRSLDGLPLAIELASARMASMSAGELRDRLDHRFRLLKGATHRPERQHTLHALVAWSYDLLDENERDVLCAAAVFAGGFDLASLVEVIGATDDIDVLSRLDSLVHKSLVVADPRGGRTRYRLLETIRQFAEDQLSATGRIEALRDRHAQHFSRDSAHQWERWNGPGWRDTVDWVEVELANLRAAFRWSMARGAIDVATDIAAHTALMGVSVHLFEAIGWTEELLPKAIAANVARLPRLHTAAGYACFAGRPLPAAANAHRATELETEPGYDPCEPGLSRFVEALAHVYAGDLARYVALAGEVASLPGAARAYGLPALVDGLQASGRVDEALTLTEASVAAARALGNPFWIAYALWTAGLAHANADPPRALAAWDEGVAVVQEHRVLFFEGFLARDAARLHTVDGDPATALLLFAKAIEVFHHAGNIAQLIITLASTPALFERLGYFEPAATLYAAITREPASLHHVPDLADLGDRLAAKLGGTLFAACTSVGSSHDLNTAAVHTLAMIDLVRSELAMTRAGRSSPGGLTRREIDVLRLITSGLTTKEISDKLFISPKTADHHIQHVYTKLGLSNRAAATRWAIEQGLVELPTGGPTRR